MRFKDAKPQIGRSNVKLDDILDMLTLKSGKWIPIRLIDKEIIAVKMHWINIIVGKTAKEKHEVPIPKICLSFDPVNETTKKNVTCPYCNIQSKSVRTQVYYLANVINRALQGDAPKKNKLTAAEKETGFKDPESNSWTPVQVLRITASSLKKMMDLEELNKHKTKNGTKTYPILDDKYGIDLNIKYDSKATGAEQYQIALSDKSPLTDEELNYLVYPLTEDVLVQLGRESLSEAKAELSRMEIVKDDEDDEDDDSVDLSKSSKSKKKAPAKSSKSKFKDDDDDEDDEDDDDEDDDDRSSKSKKKAPAKSSKSKFKDDDDEDDDSEDEDDDDEDDDSEDEDDDDSEDEDDEDDDSEDEDDRSSKSKKKAPAKSSKSKFKDDDDEDDDSEDEDDDDSEDDEDDDDSEDDDDDEDEDDEDEDDEDDDDRSSKSKKKAPAKSSKSNAKSSKKAPAKSSKSKKSKRNEVPF